MKITLKFFLSFAGEIDAILTKHHLYDSDGNLDIDNATDAATAAADIETALKAHGLAVNVKADHLIAAAPLVIAIIQGN